MPAAATAEDFCAPSEATDPQPQHINGSKPFIYKTIGGSDLRLHVFNPADTSPAQGSAGRRFLLWGRMALRRYPQIPDASDPSGAAGPGDRPGRLSRQVSAWIYDHGLGRRRQIGDALGPGACGRIRLDASRIAAVGSSAGGHVGRRRRARFRISTILPTPPIDPRPNALVLYNPALDLASTLRRSEI